MLGFTSPVASGFVVVALQQMLTNPNPHRARESCSNHAHDYAQERETALPKVHAMVCAENLWQGAEKEV